MGSTGTDFSAALAATDAGNRGALMLPWLEPEITPHVAHARRQTLRSRSVRTSARNVRAVVEAQMMAMANHAAGVNEGPLERIIATGGAAANRAILQVMANVFGAEVYSLDVGNSAALAPRYARITPIVWPPASRCRGQTVSAASPNRAPPIASSRVPRISRHTPPCARSTPRGS